MNISLRVFLSAWVILLLLQPTLVRADAPAPLPIQFNQETLANGLRVIYAPLKNAPVVHVRVLYHVGSRDERPDRQGFAHMFEHMMFRGSAHVKPEEHMKRINDVGGYSNAFTSFDQTSYVNTVPSNHLEMALYLEADRMASFKVSDDIYKIERNVVAKEWGMRQNRPYGTMFEDFLGMMFLKHSYRWTPIGNMDHLKAAAATELQEFFNKYYVPNNAVLVIAGDIDVEKVRPLVQKYYGWIPRGAEIQREIAVEPEQTEARSTESKRFVPLPKVVIGFPIPPIGTDDETALDVLGTILGGGRTSRLDRKLVNNETPSCTDVSAGPWQLQDHGVFMVQATVMQGKNAAEVETTLWEELTRIAKDGVTQAELDLARIQARKAIVEGRSTAESLASQLGESELFVNNAARVNQEMQKIDALTIADINGAATKYLLKNRSNTLRILPDPLGVEARKAEMLKSREMAGAPVVASTQPVVSRNVTFPDGYPVQTPLADSAPAPEFKKGEASTIGGVKVIVMNDPRLPIVTWNLTLRRGSHSEPVGKEGLGSLCAGLLRRGTVDLSFEELNEDLESRAITIEAGDGVDITRISGSCLTDQLDHALLRARQILRQPRFDTEQFENLKQQTLSNLMLHREDPGSVAGEEMSRTLYGSSPLGRPATPKSVQSITLDDVTKYYANLYKPNEAILVLAGDVTVEQGNKLAAGLLADWPTGDQPKVDYSLPQTEKRRIILVDNPAGKQSAIRLGIRAYDIHNDDKFAGMLAGRILSDGIESRLMKYLRAEKGYVYGIGAAFMPGRHAGSFSSGTETKFETTGATLEAIFKVFADLRGANVLPSELSEAKGRVAGGMVMEMQTIQQQAGRRVDAILNDYPIDYYDKLPSRLNQVTDEQIRVVMNRYVKENEMSIVVVAPAEKVKEQLEKLGEVTVLPMPALRDQPTTVPVEMLK